MGLTNWVKRMLARNDRRILVLGLDDAGKTTVIAKLQQMSEPGRGADDDGDSIGPASERLSVRTTKIGRITFSLWDVGGGDALRAYWRHYYAGAQGVLFVIDANGDPRSLATAASELAELGSDGQLEGLPIVVLLNKLDVDGVARMRAGTLVRTLNLEESLGRGGRPWKALPSSAINSTGLREAIEFLTEHTKPL